MAYTEIKALNYMLSEKMNEALTQAIADGWQPVSEFTVDKSSRFSVVLAKGSDNQLTEVKVYTAMRQDEIFAKALALAGHGYTIDNQIGFKNSQFFIVAYKGSKAGGGSSSVAWGDVTGKPTNFTTTTANITDATETGIKLMTVLSPAAARTAIGAGISNLALGTTSTTAKMGDYAPTWAEVTSKPAVIASGANAASAWAVIQSGAIGTTAGTAMSGDKTLATIGGVVPSSSLPAATSSAVGAVKMAVSPAATPGVTSAQVAADVALADLAAAYNLLQADYVGLRTVYSALLSNLRAAGVVA